MNSSRYHSMLRRKENWNYCAPAFYMITLTLANRSKPLLGKIEYNLSKLDLCSCNDFFDINDIKVWFTPSSIGQDIFQEWQTISEFCPAIVPLYLQLMEEHLHGILQVTKTIERPLGWHIGSFKSRCTQKARERFGIKDKLFSDGFQDSISFDSTRLDRMFKYIKDNPRRLALKRLFPNLFKIQRKIESNGLTFSCIGNHFLLNSPSFHQIQISRSASDFSLLTNEMFNAANNGAVMISPAISPGEKHLIQLAIQEHIPTILLFPSDLPKFYKPSSFFSDACLNGKLLILGPTDIPYIPGVQKITREKALYLNEIAHMMATP